MGFRGGMGVRKSKPVSTKPNPSKPGHDQDYSDLGGYECSIWCRACARGRRVEVCPGCGGDYTKHITECVIPRKKRGKTTYGQLAGGHGTPR